MAQYECQLHFPLIYLIDRVIISGPLCILVDARARVFPGFDATAAEMLKASGGRSCANAKGQGRRRGVFRA